MYNPMNQFQPYSSPQQYGQQYGNSYNLKQEIVHVNGENGARAYNMMPNSNVLLLDENNPIVWLVQTDGAGYKTVTPYKIEPYKEEPKITNKERELEERISRIEEKLDAKSNNVKNDRYYESVYPSATVSKLEEDDKRKSSRTLSEYDENESTVRTIRER